MGELTTEEPHPLILEWESLLASADEQAQSGNYAAVRDTLAHALTRLGQIDLGEQDEFTSSQLKGYDATCRSLGHFFDGLNAAIGRNMTEAQSFFAEAVSLSSETLSEPHLPGLARLRLEALLPKAQITASACSIAEKRMRLDLSGALLELSRGESVVLHLLRENGLLAGDKVELQRRVADLAIPEAVRLLAVISAWLELFLGGAVLIKDALPVNKDFRRARKFFRIIVLYLMPLRCSRLCLRTNIC